MKEEKKEPCRGEKKPFSELVKPNLWPKEKSNLRMQNVKLLIS